MASFGVVQATALLRIANTLPVKVTYDWISGERKAIARKLQENAWNYVPMVLLGQWSPPVAQRANVTGFIPLPAHVAFWNVEKT